MWSFNQNGERLLWFKENLSGFFPWDLPVVKISPEWVTAPQQGTFSGRIATFSLWTGMFRDGISSIAGETVIPLWLGRHFLFFENRVYHERVRKTAAEMKYMRRTAGHTCTDYKTNAQIAKELKITPILDKLLEYKRSWIQHVNRMSRNRLPRVMKLYCPNGRRNRGSPLKRLLDMWDWNGSTGGPTAWQIYDDDDDDDDGVVITVCI